ncbi:hypothetical protein MA20_17850 [Bradyrhizobium japonicum]|uniref:Uncharacterized protein n=1 Tax=Bradyrhizobium japonicum TaxID=375 RepID=A0A0A3XXS6_BRAJP|nr:hypothetical protein [Bradyrhizobium japonicum]KGT79195.1 hypothetical protein MA20_17850 [Bradyrhizobium japonicum]
MVGDQLHQFKEKGLREVTRLFWIFAYLWVLLGLFALHKSIILNLPDLFYHQGFAVINALVLAKVIYFAEAFNVADNLKSRPLVYPITYRSTVFSLMLILFHLIEEVLAGAWHGKPITESLAASGAGSAKEILVFGLIMFVALMPFFALREIARDIGDDRLFEQFFVRRSTYAPLQSQ